MRRVASCAVLVLLAACGGDGGGQPDAPAPAAVTTTTAASTTSTAAAPTSTTTTTTSTSTTTTTTTLPPPPVPSQSPEHAVRDGVVPALAELPLSVRALVRSSIEAGEGTWVAATGTDELDELSMATGCALGTTEGGAYGIDYICTLEYGEVLLLDGAGAILRAYPMAGAPPSWLLLTEAALYGGHIGDGALPDSTVFRIDRASLSWEVRVMPAPSSGAEPWPPGWPVLTEDVGPIVAFGPDAAGTAAESWIGDVVVDLDALERVFAAPAEAAGATGRLTVEPVSGGVGTVVTITGRGFGKWASAQNVLLMLSNEYPSDVIAEWWIPVVDAEGSFTIDLEIPDRMFVPQSGGRQIPTPAATFDIAVGRDLFVEPGATFTVVEEAAGLAVELRGDGLGAGLAFGTAFAPAYERLAAAIGPPDADSGWLDTAGIGLTQLGYCAGPETRILEWPGMNVVFSTSPDLPAAPASGGGYLTQYSVFRWNGPSLPLHTPGGIRVKASTVGDVLAIHGDAFELRWEEHWSDWEFTIATPHGELRGAVTGPMRDDQDPDGPRPGPDDAVTIIEAGAGCASI